MVLLDTLRLAQDCLPNDVEALRRHLSSLPYECLRAFAHCMSNGGNWDGAAQMAVVHGPRNVAVIGPYGTYRRGTRDRVRYSDDHGTRTVPELSEAARRHRSPVLRGLLQDCHGC